MPTTKIELQQEILHIKSMIELWKHNKKECSYWIRLLIETEREIENED